MNSDNPYWEDSNVTKRIPLHYQKRYLANINNGSFNASLLTGMYKRKIKTLIKNNQMLALALQNDRIKKEALMAESKANADVIMFSRLKFMSVSEKLKNVVAELDDALSMLNKHSSSCLVKYTPSYTMHREDFKELVKVSSMNAIPEENENLQLSHTNEEALNSVTRSHISKQTNYPLKSDALKRSKKRKSKNFTFTNTIKNTNVSTAKFFKKSSPFENCKNSSKTPNSNSTGNGILLQKQPSTAGNKTAELIEEEIEKAEILRKKSSKCDMSKNFESQKVSCKKMSHTTYNNQTEQTSKETCVSEINKTEIMPQTKPVTTISNVFNIETCVIEKLNCNYVVTDRNSVDTKLIESNASQSKPNNKAKFKFSNNETEDKHFYLKTKCNSSEISKPIDSSKQDNALLSSKHNRLKILKENISHNKNLTGKKNVKVHFSSDEKYDSSDDFQKNIKTLDTIANILSFSGKTCELVKSKTSKFQKENDTQIKQPVVVLEDILKNEKVLQKSIAWPSDLEQKVPLQSEINHDFLAKIQDKKIMNSDCKFNNLSDGVLKEDCSAARNFRKHSTICYKEPTLREKMRR